MGDEKNLFHHEINRCNRNLLILNIFITLFLLWIISVFFNKLELFSIIISLILLLIPEYFFYRLYQRYFDYRNHPLYKRFERFDNVLLIAESVEEELKFHITKTYGNYFLIQGNYFLTQNWIIYRSFLDFFAIHKTEIIWVFICETKHSVNFIPTGTTYSLEINSVFNKINKKSSIKIDLPNKDTANSFLTNLQNFSPWAIFGYDDQLRVLWRMDPSMMIQTVRNLIPPDIKI